MNTPSPSSGPPLEGYRSYLLLLAQMQLAGRPQHQLEASDIVQQTLLEAHAQQHQFSGDREALAAWLRRALANNLADAARAKRRQKRDVRREVSLAAAVEQSSQRLEAMLAGPASSPSQQAVRSEELLRLAAALEQLPDAQRQAVVLHHLQGCSLLETARCLERSDAAVAGLLHRGLKRLRESLSTE